VAKKSATTLQRQESSFEVVENHSEEQRDEITALQTLLSALRRFEAHFLQFQPQVHSAVYDFGNSFYETEQERLRLLAEEEEVTGEQQQEEETQTLE
jgi:hypothetical protein